MKNFSPVNPKSIYDFAQEWISQDIDYHYEMPINGLQEYINSDTYESVNAKIFGYLLQLTTWYEQKFIVSAFQGENVAFDYLLKSFKYALLRTEMRIANIARLTHDNYNQIRPQTLVALSPRNNSLLLCKGLALGCVQDSELLGKMLVGCLKKNWYSGFESNTIFPFIFNIFYDWRGIKVYPDKEYEPLPECYKTIASNWKGQNSSELEQAFYEACEYHIRESQSDTDVRYYQFDNLIYRVFPAELLAVLQLRKSLGLGVLEINHDLFKLPTVKLCEFNPSFEDTLLEEVKQRASFELGSFFDSLVTN